MIFTTNQKGMTLLEILVALTIFVLMAGAGYSGLQQALSIQDGLDQKRDYWRRMDTVMMLLQQDLDQAINLSPRVPLDAALSFVGSTSPDPSSFGGLMLFSRGGHFSYSDGPVSPHIRVAYRMRAGTLYRVIWPQLNMPEHEQGREFELIDGIEEVSLRFLDAGRQWRTLWPESRTRDKAIMPQAVQLRIQLEDGHQYERVFHVGIPG